MNFFDLNKNKAFYLIIFLILLFGFYFRLNFYNDGLWSDEWISYYISGLDINIFEKYNYHLLFEGASPINLYLKNIVINFFGKSYQKIEAVYIFLSLIFLFIAISIFENNDQKIFYCLLLSLNPFLIYYSGELRFYSISVFISFLSVLSFLNLNKNINKKNISLFFIITLFSVLINLYTIIFLISFLIFNFFKKNNKLIYSLIISIILFYFIISYEYLFSVTESYHNQFGGASGNINYKFFIGYFFNIFFGDIFFGMICILTFLYSIIKLRNKILNSNALFLSLIIIFTTYSMFIGYTFLVKNIFFPRHFIFIIPFIIYVITFVVIDFKNTKIKYLLVLFFVLMSFYVNLKHEKPFLSSKPNPEKVFDEILNSKIDAIYVPIVKSLKPINENNCCYFDELLFMYSSSFLESDFNFLINDQYNIYSEFWNICIVNPAFRKKVAIKETENCYGRLDFLDETHLIKKTFSAGEIKATLYKKK